MRKPPEKDEKVFEYMRGFIESRNYSPSIREVCEATGISSTATVFDCIERLIKSGRMKKAEGKKRAYELAAPYSRSSREHGTVRIPLIGKITAGTPIEAVQNLEEMVPMPDGLFGRGEMFMLRVAGESMKNAGILDGDTIVVKRQPTALNGEIAVVMVDGEATVKRFFKENGRFRLQPENDEFAPIVTADAEVLGVVTGLLRRM